MEPHQLIPTASERLRSRLLEFKAKAAQRKAVRQELSPDELVSNWQHALVHFVYPALEDAKTRLIDVGATDVTYRHTTPTAEGFQTGFELKHPALREASRHIEITGRNSEDGPRINVASTVVTPGVGIKSLADLVLEYATDLR